jgi:hypothetical protein
MGKESTSYQLGSFQFKNWGHSTIQLTHSSILFMKIDFRPADTRRCQRWLSHGFKNAQFENLETNISNCKTMDFSYFYTQLFQKSLIKSGNLKSTQILRLAILPPFLAIFLPPIYLSFTKFRCWRSFWGAKGV